MNQYIEVCFSFQSTLVCYTQLNFCKYMLYLQFDYVLLKNYKGWGYNYTILDLIIYGARVAF